MEPFIGQIQLFPYDFAPMNWTACEGQELQIGQNQALYALLGTRYGGNGKTTFSLPDLRGREPMPGTHYCLALTGFFPPRN